MSIVDAEYARMMVEQSRRERVRNAADDLLAACKNTVAAIEDCRRRLGFPTQAIADAFEECTAAIKKATKK